MINNIIIKEILKDLNVDLERSNEIIDGDLYCLDLFFNKTTNLCCEKCGSIALHIKSSKVTKTKFANTKIVGSIPTTLHRRVYICNDCSHYQTEPNTLSIKPSKRLSTPLILEILNDLKNIKMSYQDVAIKYGVSTTTILNIFDEHVNITAGSIPEVLSIDEVYNKKLTKRHYCCILYDPINKEIIDVLPSRHKLSLIDYFGGLPPKCRDKVKFVSVDMWDSYIDMAKLCFPNALICVDSFHVIENLYDVFKRIRVNIMNQFLNDKKDNYGNYKLLKKYTFLLTKDMSNIKDTIHIGKVMTMNKYQLLHDVLKISDKLKLAYELKEEYRNFNRTATIDDAPKLLDELIDKFKTSGITEYIPFYKMLKKYRQEIINSFIRINGYRINNGNIERKNEDIKTLFRISFGLRNFNRTRNRIMFSFNKDIGIKL